MADHTSQDPLAERVWRSYLTLGEEGKQFRRSRRLFGFMPSNPRCVFCKAPFRGIGGTVTKTFFDKRPSRLNPRLCNACDSFALEHQGGAEVELSLLFADVRGSTALAEGMGPAEFSQLINRFYNAVTEVLIRTDALIDKIIGDQVAGMYVPGFAGVDHAQRAVKAAQEVLKVTGHGDPDGPWIPLGAGVHTGVAFVGSVGSATGTSDITVLGDTANTAARLSSSAGEGEILVSGAAWAAAGFASEGTEQRGLELKGKTEPISVFVLKE